MLSGRVEFEAELISNCHPEPQFVWIAAASLPQSLKVAAGEERLLRYRRARPSFPVKSVRWVSLLRQVAAEKNAGTDVPAFCPASTPVKKLRDVAKNAENCPESSGHGSSLARHCSCGGEAAPVQIVPGRKTVICLALPVMRPRRSRGHAELCAMPEIGRAHV